MAFRLSKKSIDRLAGVHPDLELIVRRAIELSAQDFIVLEGVRTPERQRELYAQGRTKPGKKITWTLTSNHFVQPDGYGHAVDLVPFPVDWDDLKKFEAISDAMFMAAHELRIRIRSGADWDQDGNFRENGETDSPHWELAP